MTKKKKFYTTYNIATHWLDGGLVLCNNITEIDPSIYDNFRFNYYDDENDEYIEIYQYFITNWDDSEIEYLEKTFNLLFTYSEKLDCFILCVDHLGTMWQSVPCEVINQTWIDINKDLEYKESCNPPKHRKIREY